MAYDIRIEDIREHRETGYIEVDVRAVLVEGNSTTSGPVKRYGTDANRLKLVHGGDVMNWLMTVKAEHQAHAGLHDSVLSKLKGLKGKIL